MRTAKTYMVRFMADKDKLDKLKAEKKVLSKQLQEAEEAKAQRNKRISVAGGWGAVSGNVLGFMIGASYGGDMLAIGWILGTAVGWLLATTFASRD